MVKKKKLVLFECQEEIDSPSSALGANDFLDTSEPVTITVDSNPEADERGNGRFSNNRPTIGIWAPEVMIPFKLYARGPSVQPSMVRVARCAGFRRILSDPYIILRLRNDIADAGTLWGYDGTTGTNKALLEKIGNLMFDWTIEIETGMAAKMNFNGKGQYVARPSVSTFPDVESYRENAIAPAFRNGEATINGKEYKLVKITINGGQEVTSRPDPTAKYGAGETEMTNRMVRFDATVFQKADNSLIPHPDIEAGTRGNLDLKWGRIFEYPDLQIFSSKCVIDNVKPGDNNGVLTWEITGVIEDNELDLRIYNGNESSYSSSVASDSSDSNSSESASYTSSSSSSLSRSSSSASDSSSSISSISA